MLESSLSFDCIEVRNDEKYITQVHDLGHGLLCLALGRREWRQGGFERSKESSWSVVEQNRSETTQSALKWTDSSFSSVWKK